MRRRVGRRLVCMVSSITCFCTPMQALFGRQKENKRKEKKHISDMPTLLSPSPPFFTKRHKSTACFRGGFHMQPCPFPFSSYTHTHTLSLTYSLLSISLACFLPCISAALETLFRKREGWGRRLRGRKDYNVIGRKRRCVKDQLYPGVKTLAPRGEEGRQSSGPPIIGLLGSIV